MNNKKLRIADKTHKGASSFQSNVEREFALFHAWKQQNETFIAVA